MSHYKKIMGLPYKGSKQAIASEIVSTILRVKPFTTRVYDIFAGGCSIALEFASRGIEVVANDIDEPIISFMKLLQDKRFNKSVYLPFINKAEFDRAKKLSGAYSGFVRAVYSFNGNGVDYIYPISKEADLEALHYVYLHANDSKLAKSQPLKYLRFLNSKYDLNLTVDMDLEEVKNHIKELDLGDLTHIRRARHLENITRVLTIQSYPFLHKIVFVNENVNGLKFTIGSREKEIVYIDAPYIKTRDYKNSKPWDIETFRRDNKISIFRSEYQVLETDFKLVWSKAKRVTINPLDLNTKIQIEGLWYAK